MLTLPTIYPTPPPTGKSLLCRACYINSCFSCSQGTLKKGQQGWEVPCPHSLPRAACNCELRDTVLRHCLPTAWPETTVCTTARIHVIYWKQQLVSQHTYCLRTKFKSLSQFSTVFAGQSRVAPMTVVRHPLWDCSD